MKNGTFCFKKREIIGYSYSLKGKNLKIEIYLSNGNTINLENENTELEIEDLDKLFNFDINFWDEIAFTNNSVTNTTINTVENKTKPYNPYE